MDARTTNRPGRPTPAEAQRLHETILDFALHHFSTRGYRASTMDGIAVAFGGSKATIYRHYRSKAQLLHAAMERGVPLLADRLAAVRCDGDRPTRDVLRDFAKVLQAYHDDPQIRALWQAVSEARDDLVGITRSHSEQEAAALQPICAYFTNLGDSGRLRIDDPVHVAMCFSSLVSGGLQNFLAHRPRERSDQHLESVLTLFLEGVGTSGVVAQEPADTA